MWRRLALTAIFASCVPLGAARESWPEGAGNKLYMIRDGKVDARIYNGFRRYHAGCNHCHGPDGIGSTFAPSLVAPLAGAEAFRRIVLEGSVKGTAVMPGYARDPNFASHIDDIYTYLQDRAEGRGRPARLTD